MPERERLLSAIAREQSLLASVEEDEARARARLETLRADLGALDAAASGTPLRAGEPRAPATAADKVALFRSLFRGRTDVFPRRWQNRRTGKTGYAPACANEWVRGVCDKPRIRCSECSNQAFVSVTDQEILGHLQGRHVIGVYPLLEDETCWLLAVDFDKASWVDDASAFLQTCRSFELPASIERSRSGNGAHVWFFFSAPVAAATARRMGCALLTETMARRHELRMESYDRLFPSQDTLSARGFGNLIALPLQLEARRKDNTIFLDDDLIPHPDQWAYLAGLPQIEPAKVAHIGEEAARQGRIIGLGLPSTEDGEERAPWDRSPARAMRRRECVDSGCAEG